MKKQIPLFADQACGTEHGGHSRAGKRKTARPLATRRPMHLVLKSDRARGAWSFARKQNRTVVKAAINKLSVKYGVRIFTYEILGNHIHALVQGKSRPLLQAFLRDLPARIALAVTGARKGRPAGAFFRTSIFSRVVEWGRDLLRLRHYFFKNQLEAAGVSPGLVAGWRAFAKTVPG